MSKFGKGFRIKTSRLRVLQCGCIEEGTKPANRGLPHQGGVKRNKEPCAFIKACEADAIAELEAEEKEDEMVKRFVANYMDTGFFDLNRRGRIPRPVS